MKRFSKRWFAQIMINKLLKKELDQLKIITGNEMGATWKLSYNDVIKQLIKNFKESRRIEVSLEPKSLLGMDKKFIDSVLQVMSNYSHTKLGTADDLKATEAVFGI